MLTALLSAAALLAAPSADPLPGTAPLTDTGDLARRMVDGIHAYLDRELAAAPQRRADVWKDASPKAVAAARDRLRALLGVVDRRAAPRLEYVAGPGRPSLLREEDGCRVHAVRWAVLPGLDAEGLLIEPPGEPAAVVVAVPHAGRTPEDVADGYALDLARHGCRVLVPAVLDRESTFSNNPRLNRATNIPHREFVHRMAFEMGRTLTGYEVQTVLAGIDALKAVSGRPPVGVFGHGDGGRVALYAAALDERIAVAGVSGTFGPREGLFAEPIDRNVWGLLREFGDAEVGAFLVAPRKLVLDPDASTRTAADFWPRWPGPTPQPGRAQAAPGTLGPVPDADVTREVLRLDHYVGRVVDRAPMLKGREIGTADFLYTLLGKELPPRKAKGMARDFPTTHDPAGRQRRLFDQYVAHVQKLWQDSDAARKEFWKRADPSSPATWEQSTDQYRTHFHERVIGKLPEPTGPLNPRTRKLYDEPKWTGHEVLLDVNPDVIAYGVLLLPKDIRPGERRPVVVCQHGLEGRPTDVTNPKERTRYYNSFGAQLADRGYIVYAPQNPYIFGTHFRQLQRKANPLGLSLFSFVVRQHQRTLDWLETLPQVDAKRIGFYGLSYGGKTAMRVPAIERRYALSICSGDFNEWVGKNVSVNLDRGYMWTSEYEMYEFDLGHTFNYAEMAYLIAPRPFMAERGHDDGVGTDEMVAWEYAKVRYLYANKLRLPDRTAIEFFPGGHEIHGEGTFAFLDRHLNWTPR